LPAIRIPWKALSRENSSRKALFRERVPAPPESIKVPSISNKTKRIPTLTASQYIYMPFSYLWSPTPSVITRQRFIDTQDDPCGIAHISCDPMYNMDFLIVLSQLRAKEYPYRVSIMITTGGDFVKQLKKKEKTSNIKVQPIGLFTKTVSL
jgi:hypothetical protein